MEIAKYWKTIVDTLQDGLIVVNRRGIIIAVNPAAERLTGYRSEELIGKSCRILNCTGCQIRNNEDKWCQLFHIGQIQDKRCTITNKDQRSVHIVKSASVLRDEDGAAIGAVETLSDMSEIIRKQQEIKELRKTFSLNDEYHGLIGNSPLMQNLYEIIENVAQSDAPVLIQGESGTGKELIARAIHEAGHRKDKPYIKVNCAALNENLLESELFGHVRGAFTGATQSRIGRFEAAHEGTLFLDEIGDIPLATQIKLLRVLEEQKIERVGDHVPISVDVRIITATNKNLDELIRNELFREDFFFRINVFPICAPSLSERREDIPLIVQHFIRQNAIKSRKKIIGITPDAMNALNEYNWPGNIRELRNAIDYAFVLCPGGEIGKKHLPPKNNRMPYNIGKEDSVFQTERKKLLDLLGKAGGNQSEVARILGISRVTVWKRMKKYGIRHQFSAETDG
jgi:two-component system, NtrC family, response regulator HydG